MSNTDSPRAISYRICKTDEAMHLNGVITLIDFGNNEGVAVVYVSEKRRDVQSPVWHVSSEIIKGGSGSWETKYPHIRINEHGMKELQSWSFTTINNRSDGPGKPENDNGKNYQSYIEYDFAPANKQGDGTGTAGNTETGE